MSVQSPRQRMDLSVLWSAMLPGLWLALRRFPLPATCAILIAAFYLFDLDELLALPRALSAYLGWELAGAFLWTLTVAIWAEAGERSWWDRLLANMFGLAIIFLLLTGAGVLHTSPALLIMTLVLGVSLAAHQGLEPHNDAFWLFNRQLWFGAGMSLIGGFVVVIGLMAAAGSIEYLFDLRMPDGLYTKIWIGAMGLLAPLHWLTVIPRSFGKSGGDDELSDYAASPAGLLLRYIVVPAMVIFTLVLYRYAFKIAQDGQLPPGRLGPVILAFVFAGTATFIMCYPLRNSGGPLVRLYWRFWFALAVVPTGLLVLAAYIRIDAFGLTEARYLVALVALWLLILAAAFMILRVNDLRLVPASLAALLILGSIGPPGATGLSLRSQTARLAAILEANGLLVENRLVVKPAGQIKLRRGDEAAIRSIIDFLFERGELVRLAPWFEGTGARGAGASAGASPFARGIGARGISARQPALGAEPLSGKPLSGRQLRRAVSAALGVPRSPIGARPARAVVFYARNPKVFSTGGAARMAGPVHLSLGPNDSRQITHVALGTGRDLAVMLDQRFLVVEDKAGRQAVFDLVAVARKIAWFENKKALVPALTEPRRIAPIRGALKAKLVLTSLQGQRTGDGSYAFTQLSCWLLFYGR